MKSLRLPLILIVIILTGIAFRLFTPRLSLSPSPSPQTSAQPSTILSQPDLTTLFSTPSSITSNLNLQNLPQFPPSLPTYILTSLSSDWHSQLAINLSFTTTPKIYDQLQIWSQDNRSLIINTKTLAVSYTESLPDTISNLDRATIATIIKPLLQKLPTAKLWETAAIKIDYFSPSAQGNEGLTPSNAASAAIAKVNLTPQFNNLPILALNPSIGLLQVTLNINNHTLSLSTQLVASNFQEDQAYPIISPLEALNQLNQQKATVVQLQQVGTTYLDKTKTYSPQDTQINNLSLAYLFDAQQPTQVLQPIYVFSGTTTMENGQSASITLYLPAIDPKYLLAP